ncbi:hypothetical protein QBC37DRAFT_324190 [Rhypophila decipiens]|uniref:Lipoprotein n=1 Tax=Rhypophila decipiens TaxID=261697 RepID=A0AAN6Y0T9_9PEZI|nr:hypothetical protein QBC37DRAFT_324190 [Rhypophila decipiens]
MRHTLILLGVSLLPFTYGCDVWQDGSYALATDNPEPYFKTFDTIIISATIGPFPKGFVSTATYDETIEVSTGFELSTGDPLVIISTSLSIPFSRPETKGRQYAFTYRAGVIGRIGFTPVFVCTKGTLTGCDGSVSNGTETCAPWKIGGVVQGDYTWVQS